MLEGGLKNILLTLLCLSCSTPCVSALRHVKVVKSATCRYSYYVEEVSGFENSECQVSMDTINSLRDSWHRTLYSLSTVQPTCVVTAPQHAINLTIYCCDPTWPTSGGSVCNAEGSQKRIHWYKSLPNGTLKYNLDAPHIRENLTYFSFKPEPCNENWCPVPNVGISDPYVSACSLNMRLNHLVDAAMGLYTCIVNVDDEATAWRNATMQPYLIRREGHPCHRANTDSLPCRKIRPTVSANPPATSPVVELLSQAPQYAAVTASEGDAVCLECHLSPMTSPAHWTFSGVSTSNRGVRLHAVGTGLAGMVIDTRPGISVCGDLSQYMVIEKMSEQHAGDYTCTPGSHFEAETVTSQSASVSLTQPSQWNDIAIAATAAGGTLLLIVLVFIMSLIVCYPKRTNPQTDHNLPPAAGDRPNILGSIEPIEERNNDGDDGERTPLLSGVTGVPAAGTAEADGGARRRQPQGLTFKTYSGSASGSGGALEVDLHPPPTVRSRKLGHSTSSPAARAEAAAAVAGGANGNVLGTEWGTPNGGTDRQESPRHSGRSPGPLASDQLASTPAQPMPRAHVRGEDGGEPDGGADELLDDMAMAALHGGSIGSDVPYYVQSLPDAQSLPSRLNPATQPSPTAYSDGDRNTPKARPENDQEVGGPDRGVLVTPNGAKSNSLPPDGFLASRHQSPPPPIQPARSRPSQRTARRKSSHNAPRSGAVTAAAAADGDNVRSSSSDSVGDPHAALHQPIGMKKTGQGSRPPVAAGGPLHYRPRSAMADNMGRIDPLDDIFSDGSNEHSGFHSPPFAAGNKGNPSSKSFLNFWRGGSNKQAGYRSLQSHQRDRENRPRSAPPVDDTQARNHHIQRPGWRAGERSPAIHGQVSPESADLRHDGPSFRSGVPSTAASERSELLGEGQSPAEANSARGSGAAGPHHNKDPGDEETSQT